MDSLLLQPGEGDPPGESALEKQEDECRRDHSYDRDRALLQNS
jgi:hypothetical protein